MWEVIGRVGDVASIVGAVSVVGVVVRLFYRPKVSITVQHFGRDSLLVRVEQKRSVAASDVAVG